jgi:FimV-like protein
MVHKIIRIFPLLMIFWACTFNASFAQSAAVADTRPATLPASPSPILPPPTASQGVLPSQASPKDQDLAAVEQKPPRSLAELEQMMAALKHEDAVVQKRLNNLNMQMALLRHSFQQSTSELLKRLEDLRVVGADQDKEKGIPTTLVLAEPLKTQEKKLSEAETTQAPIASPSAPTSNSLQNQPHTVETEVVAPPEHPVNIPVAAPTQSAVNMPIEANAQKTAPIDIPQKPAQSSPEALEKPSELFDVQDEALSAMDRVDREENTPSQEVQPSLVAPEEQSQPIVAKEQKQESTEQANIAPVATSAPQQQISASVYLEETDNTILMLGIGLAGLGFLMLLFLVMTRSKEPQAQPDRRPIEDEDTSHDILEDEINFQDSTAQELETVLPSKTDKNIPEVVSSTLTPEEEDDDEDDYDYDDDGLEEDEDKAESYVLAKEELGEDDLDFLSDRDIEEQKTTAPPELPNYDFSEQIEDAIAIKLDLARAYLEMKDFPATEEILRAVIAEGSALQQKEAAILMGKLNAAREG